MQGLIADLIGGTRSVISVDSREISESRLGILKTELMQIFRRRIRHKEIKLALLRLFVKFTASLSIFNLFGAVTPILVGEGSLADAPAGIRAADFFIKNGVLAVIMLLTVRLVATAVTAMLNDRQSYLSTQI